MNQQSCQHLTLHYLIIPERVYTKVSVQYHTPTSMPKVLPYREDISVSGALPQLYINL